MHQVTIISNIEIAEGVFILGFEREFEFVAGQVIGITTQKNIAPRLYSICSSPNENVVQILYNLRKQGELTPELAKISAGSTIFIDTPRGNFTSTNQPAWWIATGTGIAPFYAMLKSESHLNKTLIHGERSPDRFYFSTELEAILSERYIRCVSQTLFDGAFKGRVTDYLKSIENLPTNILYYLCGTPEMVVDARDILIAKGIDYKNIRAEIYF